MCFNDEIVNVFLNCNETLYMINLQKLTNNNDSKFINRKRCLFLPCMRQFPKIYLLNSKSESKIMLCDNCLCQTNSIDFSSNDYLGLSKSETIFNETHQYLIDNNIIQNGATGSRLLSGNHKLYPETENYIAQFHQSESALIFNSGYDANVGFFSLVPQKGDLILYDELCHASIRDGIQLSNAKAYKFNHNDFEDLEKLIFRNQNTVFILLPNLFFPWMAIVRILKNWW